MIWLHSAKKLNIIFITPTVRHQKLSYNVMLVLNVFAVMKCYKYDFNSTPMTQLKSFEKCVLFQISRHISLKEIDYRYRIILLGYRMLAQHRRVFKTV